MMLPRAGAALCMKQRQSRVLPTFAEAYVAALLGPAAWKLLAVTGGTSCAAAQYFLMVPSAEIS